MFAVNKAVCYNLHHTAWLQTLWPTKSLSSDSYVYFNGTVRTSPFRQLQFGSVRFIDKLR